MTIPTTMATASRPRNRGCGVSTGPVTNRSRARRRDVLVATPATPRAGDGDPARRAPAERALELAVVDDDVRSAQITVVVDERERQLVAAQCRAEHRLRPAADRHGAAEALVALHEDDGSFGAPAILLERPRALDARGHVPEIGVARFDRQEFVRLPVAHVEGVRRHARAGLHRQDQRAQLEVEIGKQVHRDDRRLREILLEDVAGDDLDASVDACTPRVASRQVGHVLVVFDADRARAELARRGNRNPAVAGTEVVHDVVARDLRGGEHRLDERIRRRNPDDVLARLAHRGLVDFVAVVGRRLRSHRMETGDGDQEGQHK
jgi:hypothetical protein